ncbi:uncharacterized protein METZ01_LOCUS247263 [marine metagenome]|uniref:Band 7 domain-containing protein n=1 Tax=marine metagenome TaxID=408172 RepID=A0A382I574_9ZZZZ
MKAKKIVVFVVGLLLLMVFLSLMFTYQVRSNEIVLVHSWSGHKIKYGSKDDAGLKFRLPWPLQKVYKLDGRVHVMETGLDEVGSLEVAVYAGWHVKDAEKFRKEFGRFRSAEAMMRQAQVQLNELVKGARTDIMSSKVLDFLEKKEGESSLDYVKAEEEIREIVEKKAEDLGLGIKFLGIKRVGLSDTLAQGIIEGMVTYKQARINALNEETQRASAASKNKARTEARAIEVQAESNATSMRNKALAEVTKSYKQADSSEERARLAIILKQIKALEVLRGKQIQLIISDNHPLFNVFDEVMKKPASKE